MADGCAHLPKVIVLLALLFRISYPTILQDDLLERIKQSRSNDPEVRSFLQSVLRHHSDFRWIFHQAEKYNRKTNYLNSQQNYSSKNKRSFLFSKNEEDSDESMKYHHDSYDDDGQEAIENGDDIQSFAGNSNEDLSKDEVANGEVPSNLDFEGPMNDVYPYQESDGGIPQDDRRFVRETQDSFLYDDRHLDDDDLLEGTPGGDNFENGAREEDEAELVSDNRHDRLKRSALSKDELLKEKSRLSRFQGHKPRVKFIPLAFHMPGDAIEVIPNGERGVNFVPGVKLEKYGEFVQSDQDVYNQEEQAQASNSKININKRKCVDNPVDTDFKVQELFDANKSKALGIDVPLSEFYYSAPHDIAGLNQDIAESTSNINVTCKKFRRGFMVEPWNKFPGKTVAKKSVKIKIFNNGQVLRQIDKNQESNDVVLSNRAEEGNFRSVPSNTYFGNHFGTPSNEEAIDNTLQKIDSIISHDEASLKSYQHAALEVPWNNERTTRQTTKITTTSHQDDHHPASHTTRNHKHRGESCQTKTPRLTGKNKYLNPQKLYGEFERPVPPGAVQSGHPEDSGHSEPPEHHEYLDHTEHPDQEYSPKKIPVQDSNTILESEAEDAQNRFPNKLEDQTEPTSAMEQKELGRLNNNFHTEPMNMHTTSENILIIPFKKTSNRCTPVNVQLLIDTNLKESEDLLGSLALSDSRLIRNSHVDIPEEIRDWPPEESSKKRSRNQPKAEAFRSRKLFSMAEDADIIGEDDDDDSDRGRKDIRKVLGMRKDEDYSEDKIDFFGGNTKGPGTKRKDKKVGEEEEVVQMHQRLLGSVVNSQQERRALKARLAKTKSHKLKKDIHYGLVEEDAEEGQKQDMVAKDQQSLGSRSLRQNILVGNRVLNNLNRCCQNSNSTEGDDKSSNKSTTSAGCGGNGGSDSHDDSCGSDHYNRKNGGDNNHEDQNVHGDSKYGPGDTNHGDSTGHSGNGVHNENDDQDDKPGDLREDLSKNNGNELDIIEKTQAILLHVTGPSNQIEGPDVGSQFEEFSTMTKPQLEDRSELVMKRIGEDLVTEGDKNTGDVVSEIFKLVQNYKNKVSEYNSKNRHTTMRFTSMPAKNLKEKDSFYGSNPKNRDHLDSIESTDPQDRTIRTIRTIREFTTKETKVDQAVLSTIMDDQSLHGHSRQKLKKLHPSKDTKCKDQYNDQEMDFVMPVLIREVYNKPEVVADDITDSPIIKKSDSEVDGQATMTGTDTKLELGNKDKNAPYPRKRIIHRNYKELPMETEDKHLENDKELEDTDILAKAEELEDNQNMDHLLHKRDLGSEDDYTEDELNKLIGMVDDTSSNMKVDQDLLKRYRRYKNFEPFYENIPRIRHDVTTVGARPGTTMSPTTQLSLAHLANTTEKPRPICGDVEFKIEENDLLGHKDDKIKKKHHKCLNAHDEFGETCHLLEHDEKKKSKAEIAERNKNRELNHERIYADRVDAKQHEEEPIKRVLNGHAVLDLMDVFRRRLKENPKLNTRFGQSLSPKCAQDEVEFIRKHKEIQTKTDVRHAQLMLHQVIVLMNKIVAEQVHRRTCMILSPTLRAFLKKIASRVNKVSKSNSVAEGYPLPGAKDSQREQGSDEVQGDFLFPGIEDEDKPQTLDEQAIAMKKKINMIRILLNKYTHMSHNCRIQVQTVHDYLLTNLRMLEKLYHEKHFSDSDSCDVPCARTKLSTASTAAPDSTSAHPSSSAGTRAATTGGPTVVAKVRAAAYYPPTPARVKVDNMDRTFRDFDSDGDAYSDSNSGEYPSVKYKKLVEAAASYRRRRQIEERLARLFGRSYTKKEEFVASTQRIDDSEPDLSNVAFEAPMVYSLH